MKVHPIVPVLLVTLCLAPPAIAQTGSGPGNGMGNGAGMGPGAGMGRGAGSGMPVHRIPRTDEEFATIFATMDGNGDGAVTEEEFMSVRMGPGAAQNPARMTMMQSRKEAKFGVLDTDGSGTLSLQEFIGRPQP